MKKRKRKKERQKRDIIKSNDIFEHVKDEYLQEIC